MKGWIARDLGWFCVFLSYLQGHLKFKSGLLRIRCQWNKFTKLSLFLLLSNWVKIMKILGNLKKTKSFYLLTFFEEPKKFSEWKDLEFSTHFFIRKRRRRLFNVIEFIRFCEGSIDTCFIEQLKLHYYFFLWIGIYGKVNKLQIFNLYSVYSKAVKFLFKIFLCWKNENWFFLVELNVLSFKEFSAILFFGFWTVK